MRQGISPAIWLALAVTFVAGWEGLRTTAYEDLAGVPTICYGETVGVRYGDTTTTEQCDAKLRERLLQFNAEISKCLPDNLPETRRAAFVSMAYNVGSGNFCKSSVARYARSGEWQKSCDSMLLWNKVAGQEVKGLTNRRKAERELCLKGE